MKSTSRTYRVSIDKEFKWRNRNDFIPIVHSVIAYYSHILASTLPSTHIRAYTYVHVHRCTRAHIRIYVDSGP